MECLQLCTHIFLVLPSSTMEEVDESETNWLDGFGEELAKDLLDDTTSVLLVPDADDMPASAPSVSVLNKLISTVYSGPTISDIESALSLTFWGSIDNQSQSRPVISLPEKGIGKSESKYTLRIKSSGSALADDGYKWRKYGQKSIKNSPNPRSYYRCTNPRCNAKKQVEKSTEDPEMLIVTYEGLHLHYTYSHFLLPRPQDSPSAGLHVSKKPKIQTVISETPEAAEPKTHSTIITDEEEQRLQQVQKQSEKVGEGNTEDGFMKDFTTGELVVSDDVIMLEEEQSPQGLLEDVVPWLVRKPYSTTTSSSEQSSSYSQSSPSYSSTFSWSPAYCYLDEAILSDLI